MTEAELIKEFIRVDKTPGGTKIHVLEITWNGPHEPVSTWKLTRELPQDAPQAEIDQAIKKVLEDSEYFSVCAECKKRKPNGWMMGGMDICQECGSDQGVVF